VLLAIALSGALGAGIFNSLVSLTIVFMPQIARVAESVTAQARNRDYVEAARATGAQRRSPSCACMCWAMCWGPSLSTPPA
jgi:ABC-type dipeptide/oligopeptide/nickel transport system permease subunit